jgi:hypothetical protein
MTTRELSAPARCVIHSIGNGLILAVPHDGDKGRVIHTRFSKALHGNIAEYDVDAETIKELVNSRNRYLRELTEYRDDCILGWRELGLPGETHRVFCLIQ